MSKQILFLSDTHFKYHSAGIDERKKRALFLRFLESLDPPERLYLVGDIFDFWFEHRYVVPSCYRDVLSGLYSLAQRGTKILVMGGNHDFWLGDHLERTYGFTVLPPLVTHDLQGRRVTITHGDMLIPRDYAYKALKTLIRSRPVVALARLVHPDLLFAFAARFSRASKEITSRATERSARRMISIAPNSFFRWNNDVFIMGHVHYPHIERCDGREFVILGDWEEHASYARLVSGELSIEYYRPDPVTDSEIR